MKVLTLLVVLFLGAACDKSPTAPTPPGQPPRGVNGGIPINATVPTDPRLGFQLETMLPDPGARVPAGTEGILWATITNQSSDKYLQWQLVIVKDSADQGVPTPSQSRWGIIPPSGPDNPRRGMVPVRLTTSPAVNVPYLRVRGCYVPDFQGYYCNDPVFLSDLIRTDWVFQ